MLCSEIIAVCSQIHTKHINKLCGQNVELLNVKVTVHTVNATNTIAGYLTECRQIEIRRLLEELPFSIFRVDKLYQNVC